MTNATVTTPSGQPLGISHKPSPTEAMFDEFKAANKPAFIGYLPYGFPDSDYSLKAFRTMVEHGVDAVEIGLPYSDPVMDGPVIQAASQIAIDNGEKIANVFKAVETVANAGGVPLVMSYWNLIYHYGVERFARDFENAGGAGLITPDLIPDEAGEWIEASDRHGLDRIFLVSPDSTDSRLKVVAGNARGFVYAASLANAPPSMLLRKSWWHARAMPARRTSALASAFPPPNKARESAHTLMASSSDPHWCTPCLTNPGKTQSMRPRVSRRWPPKPKSLRTASITRVSQSKPF